MTKEQAEFFKNAAEEVELEIEVRNNYSGRGMYGETTYAIIVDSLMTLIPALLCRAAYGYVSVAENGLFDNFKLRQDNMGLGIVLY